MSSDPRKLGGTISGPGGPYERHGVVVDTSNAVLLDGSQVALVEAHRSQPGAPASELTFAVELQGRINKTSDRVNVLYITGADGVAALVSELLAVASRAGTDLTSDVLDRLKQRLDEVPT